MHHKISCDILTTMKDAFDKHSAKMIFFFCLIILIALLSFRVIDSFK